MIGPHRVDAVAQPAVAVEADIGGGIAEIAAALRAAGIEPHDAAPGGERGLRASIPPDKIEAARQALEKLGITVPADGELRVELRGK